MTIYGYKCPSCEQTYTSEERADRLHINCHVCDHTPLHRDFRGIAVRKQMQEHWNGTVNMPIRSEHQFKEQLKIRSEELSSYTGVEQRLEMLEPEQAMAGVTPEGLDSTNRERVRRGLKPIDLSKL